MRLERMLSLFALCLACGVAQAQEPAKITYDDHVRPIFREHCFSCHSADTKKADLALDNYGATMLGGASGAVIEPGDPSISRLWMLVSHQETPEMPPQQDKLAQEKLTLIEQWIAGGALENSGSVATVKPKPRLEMGTPTGANRPDGPPIVPEGVTRQPFFYSPRRGAITALAASPWAPVAAVAGHKQISLYNTDTGSLMGVLPYPEGTPYVLKFSRSGAVLLAGGGRGGASGKVILFDVKTGQRVGEIGDELDAILAADINNDHSLVALGGPRRVVRIYSVADGTLVNEIKKHTEWIYALEFSPDGVLLATADRNGGMFVWESDTAREYQNLAGHGGAITDLSWRDDSNLLASASEDGTVRLWEMENGTQVKNWGAHGGVESVEFTHDGRLVTCGRDRQTVVWDQNGAALITLEAFSDLALEACFSHDGARVLAGDMTGEVRLWNTADGTRAADLACNPPTLEMALEQATQRATAAQAVADAAAVEFAAAQQRVADINAALESNAQQLATAQTAATDAEAQRVAAEQRLAELTAAAQAAAEKAAASGLAEDQQAAQQAETDRLAAQTDLEAKTVAAQEAAQVPPTIQAEIDRLNGEKGPAEQVAAEKAAAAAAATQAAQEAASAAQQAAAELQTWQQVQTAQAAG